MYMFSCFNRAKLCDKTELQEILLGNYKHLNCELIAVAKIHPLKH